MAVIYKKENGKIIREETQNKIIFEVDKEFRIELLNEELQKLQNKIKEIENEIFQLQELK